MRRPVLLAIAAIAALSTPPAVAQRTAAPAEDQPSLADMQSFSEWLRDYRSGAIRMMHDLQVDEAALADANRRMAALARWNDLPSAQALFEAASVDPQPSGARSSVESIEFQAELQPWKIRRIAREHLAGMTAAGFDDWLLQLLHARDLRDAKAVDARRRADAAMQVLAARGGTGGKLALLEATGRMPDALRLRALDLLGQTGEIELVNDFLRMLGDRDDKIRIAAANALGTAIAPHSDETLQQDIDAEVASQRDQAIDGLRKLLIRDRVWQVRAAACENLAKLRCKAAIPALIDGYEAELARKKDPWAMDMRIHRRLEGLTGQRMLPGSATPWQTFWKNEGASMRLLAEGAKPPAGADTSGRYGKFFSIDLESDRVLFVVDFSGSMDEPITLRTSTTVTKSGTSTTKAKLVVEELKRIVMSFPDDSYFNVVVFSDDVRVWRPRRDGKPELVKMNDETRDDLLGSFLDALQPRGPTNLYGALDAAVGFAGSGLTDKHYELGFDTVYVLSDGAPSFGEVTDKDEIRRLVSQSNRLKRLTIHCVTFGEKNDTDFLRLLAEENGGRHIHVE